MKHKWDLLNQSTTVIGKGKKALFRLNFKAEYLVDKLAVVLSWAIRIATKTTGKYR